MFNLSQIIEHFSKDGYRARDVDLIIADNEEHCDRRFVCTPDVLPSSDIQCDELNAPDTCL